MVRGFSAVAAVGGLIIVASFFFLNWESYELSSFGGGSTTEVSNAGHELRVDNDDNDPVEGYLVATTLFAAGLPLLLFLLALVPALARRLMPVAVTVAALVAAWIGYSIYFFGKYDVETAVGVPIAWLGAALAAGGAVAAAVAPQRAGS